jgi:methionyl aminopeptidase
MIQVLNDKQIIDLRKSGEVLSSALKETLSYLKPGINTFSLDEVAERSLRRQGALPSFKNYYVAGSGRFPSSLCVSINSELVHGIPDTNKIIKDGDLVSLDLGANYNGMFSDMAITVGIGKISKKDQKLIEVTESVLRHAISQLHHGIKTGDLGNLIEKYVESHGYVSIHDLVGHGIGTSPHMEPQVPNFGKQGMGQEINNGMAIAIEPMVSVGDNRIKIDRDNWTIRMKNGQKCAHFEHTVLIYKNKVEIITKL